MGAGAPPLVFMDHLLNEIEKPSRYIGGEIGAVVKDLAAVDVRIVLAFPDIYEVGMSHYGFQLLYDVLNNQPWCYAERVFCPWPDMEALLRKNEAPLFSLETKLPISTADMVGFSLQYELAATGVLQILDLAGIPLRAENRRNEDPLIVAGGPCTTNPEPWAPFFDVLFVGEGEEGIVEIARLLRKCKAEKLSRAETLAKLAKIPGLYVPSARRPRYRDGHLDGFELDPGQPTQVLRRLIGDLETAPAIRQPILPHTRAVHDRLVLEVMRGCTRGCRFCQAGYLYRPVRERSAGLVKELIDQGLAASGHDEVTLLSLSSGDWSPVSDAIPFYMDELAPKHVALSLPSLRTESLTDEMMRAIRQVRRTGFTIAPEAATERLRKAINKHVADEEILSTVHRVYDAGWELLKCYFMIGLPTETEQDVAAIVDLVSKIFQTGRSLTNRARLNVTISIFVPKPHTPFERFGMLPLEKAKQRLAMLKGGRWGKSVVLKFHDPEKSLLEAAIARGDRRVADAIESAYRRGVRFDAWREHFQMQPWLEAFTEFGLDLAAIATATFADEDLLPWHGVDIGLSPAFLLAERDRAIAGETTEDCRWGACSDCGICDDEVVLRLAEPFAAKKIKSTPERPAAKLRYWLSYRKEGPAKWLSHLELATAFARSVRRAGLPIAYSEGFHPQARLSFGPPPAVGISSRAEIVELILTKRVPEQQVASNLNSTLPQGVSITSVRMMPRENASVFESVQGWDYLVDLSLLPFAAAFESSVRRFLEKTESKVEVVKKGKVKAIDARDLVQSAEIIDNELRLSVWHRQSGGLKPTILVAHILGLAANQVSPIALTKQATRFDAPPSL